PRLRLVLEGLEREVQVEVGADDAERDARRRQVRRQQIDGIATERKPGQSADGQQLTETERRDRIGNGAGDAGRAGLRATEAIEGFDVVAALPDVHRPGHLRPAGTAEWRVSLTDEDVGTAAGGLGSAPLHTDLEEVGAVDFV